MSSLRKATVFLLLSALFAEKLNRNYGRSLLQRSSSRSEFGCVLTPQELQTYSGEEGRWLVTDSGFEALNGDIQRLVNCTEDGDVLFFDFEEPVQPSRRITVPWNLTISAFVENPRIENGAFPEARRKVTFLCPRQDEGVFLVAANEALFANFIFQNCSLNHRSGEADQGIITIANCNSRQTLGSIAIHHLEFEANFLNRSAALYVQEPSCSSVQIIDVTFQNNSCIGTCAASLVGRTEIRSITLTGNRFFEGGASSHVLIGVRTGSTATVEALTASRNNGTTMHFDNANLTISNSHIFQNSGGLTSIGHYSAGVTLLQSTGVILNSRFEENTGTTGSSIAADNSSLVIGGMSVIGCNSTNQGGGISLLQCPSVRILDSFIANNSAGLNGGGIYSNNTANLQIENTTLQLNFADRGGGLYCEEGDLVITSSTFLNNNAGGDGGGLYFSWGTIALSDSNFTGSRALSYGGGGFIEGSSYSLRNLTLIQNEAVNGGGFALLDSSGTLNNPHFDGASVHSNGGGVHMIRRNASVVLNCTFVNNSAHQGGGIYMAGSMGASVVSCRFVRNRVSFSGGGACFEDGDYTLEANTFEENASNELGGGFDCIFSTLNVTDTRFMSNSAFVRGGGSHVYRNSSALFANCTWDSNLASSSGGAAYFRDGASATITASIFNFNQAEFGGVAYSTNANISLLYVNCSDNSATRSAAIIFFMQSDGIVSNCSFIRNSADWGGVFYFHGSTVSISMSNFVSNEATENGGAIRSGDLSNLTIEDSYLASNFASEFGGAIHVSSGIISAKNLRFQYNRASQRGGAVRIQRNTSASISHTVFFNDSSVELGGALSAEDSVLRLRNISIASCSSEKGGGVHLERASASINDTLVTICEASESGGGIGMIESNVTSYGLNISFNAAAGTSRHESEGGGIAMERSSELHVRNATLDGNRARSGAGIYSIGESVVFVSGGYFHNNSARESGGGASFHESSVTIKRVLFEQNRARHGGAVYVLSSNLTLNNSQLIYSFSTDAGGSILAQRDAIVVVEGTTIISSEALNGGGIMLVDSYFLGVRVQFQNCSARQHGGGVGLNESSSFLCTECLLEGNNASLEGGALGLESLSPQLLAFQLENTTFRNNGAAFGGAIHFQSGDGSANCSDVNSTNCTFLALAGCVFENNRARLVGGAILANNPSAVRVSCDPSDKADPVAYFALEEFGTLSELSNLEVVCDSWTRNNAPLYGSIVASYARRLLKSIQLGPNRTEEIPGNQYILLNHSSGAALPTISLEAVDGFSQGPAMIQGDRLVEGVATTEDGLFEGNVIVRMEGGRGNFSGITCYGEPGNHDIHINFSERVMPTLIVVVEIRHCVIGEARAGNGTLCEPCGDTTYNFDPLRSEECITCPDDATCDSRAIQPKKGFWHQTPCSNHVQLCLSEISCDEKGRDAELKALASNIQNCTFDQEALRKYSEALCREGYTGPLCGSCNASHGKTRSFRCEECYGRFASLFLLILVGLVLLGLTAFAIRSALPAHRHPTNRSQQRGEESASSPPVNLQMVEMWCTGRVPPEVIHPHLRTRRNEANIAAAAAQQIGQRNVQLAKSKATEIFKITINYLQVIAIAIAVNVAWSGALIALFETAEFIGGVTSEAAGRSTDCLISADSSIPRSAVRTIVNLIIPAVVAAICAVFWALAMVWNQQGHPYLMKRCLLSVVVVSYLSYIAVTKTAVNVFYCVDVHDSIELGDSSTTKYWAVDTALKCYEGSHNVLAFVFGIPVLVVFSFGFPWLVACVLITQRGQEELQSQWLFETAGFLYKPYDNRFVFWESVVLLRKAALAVIVVFAYPLGGNLQGILAVCVLVIASYFHTLCSPYRSELEALNRLERLSLLISSLTFASGLFFNDDRTSPEARAIIAVFVIIANVGIFVYFCVRLFVAGATYLGIVLENEGVAVDQDATALHKVTTFIRNRFHVHLASALEHFTVFTYRQPEDSNPSEV